jgi:DNA-binding XRE family transcriptional regulator
MSVADTKPVDLDLSNPKLKRVVRRNKGTERLTLRALREGMGKTQADVAPVMGIDQGEVSRLERRSDFLVSTLRKYASACGCRLELVFVLEDGRRVPIADPAPSSK